MRARQIAPLLLALSLAAAPLAASEEPSGSPYFKTLYQSLPEGTYEALSGWEDALHAHLDALLDEHGSTDNAAAAREILELTDAPRIDFDSEDELIGDWRVRSLQADGLGVYAYSWFPARIYREGQALVFDKASGSQRHRGLMALASKDAVFFAGALYYGYEEPRMHSAHMAPGVDADPAMDATALIHKLGPDHYLMVFDHDPGRFRFYEIAR